MFVRLCILSILMACSNMASAVEYLSVLSQADLYDAPSLHAKKQGTVSGTMPYEVVVSLSDWIKVRDFTGKMYWLEARTLSKKRSLLTTAMRADVLQQPIFSSSLLFQVGQYVSLEWLETTGTGWVKVRHADGEVGYVRSEDVWGE